MRLTSLGRSLWSLVGHENRWRLVGYVAGSVLVAAFELVGFSLILPLVGLLTDGTDRMGSELERVTGITDPDRLVMLLGLAIFVAFVLKAVSSLAFRWWSLGFIFRAEAVTSSRLMEVYLRAPYEFHLRRNSSEMLRNVNDGVSAVYANALAGLLAGVTELFVISAIIVVLAIFQPLTTLVAFIYFVIAMMGYQRLVHGRSSGAGGRYQAQLLEAVRIVQEGLGGVKESVVRGTEGTSVSRLYVAKRGMASARRQMLFLIDSPRYYLEVAFLAGAGLLAAVVFTMMPRKDAVAVIGLFLAAGFRVLPSLTRLLGSLANVRAGIPAVELVCRDFSELLPLERPAVEVAPLRMHDRIELRNVVFSFSGKESPAIDHLDLDIPRGSSLAITGASGAGKSTLADVLLGLHPPSSGQLLVDGCDVWASHAVQSWQRTIGYVPQEVFLLDASLRENIVFGLDSDIDEQRLLTAIHLAELDDVVAGLAEGVETEVGERGARLSGGQRQRVGLARALYLQPDVLVLDEATSSLDSETEARLTTLIESLYGRLTVVIVTHRLATVRNADQIIFLESGRRCASGSFTELVSSSAEFARMARAGGLTI